MLPSFMMAAVPLTCLALLALICCRRIIKRRGRPGSPRAYRPQIDDAIAPLPTLHRGLGSNRRTDTFSVGAIVESPLHMEMSGTMHVGVPNGAAASVPSNSVAPVASGAADGAVQPANAPHVEVERI